MVKLFYQRNVGFLLVIITSIIVLAHPPIHFATIQAYSQSYSRLEGCKINWKSGFN